MFVEQYSSTMSILEDSYLIFWVQPLTTLSDSASSITTPPTGSHSKGQSNQPIEEA